MATRSLWYGTTDRRETGASRAVLALAWLSVGALAASYLSILYHLVDVVGRVEPFVLLVVGALGMAVVSRALPRRAGVALGVVFLVAGMAAYISLLPPANQAALGVDRFLGDMAALLTGFSVLRMTDVATWALGVTVGPTFLVAYFAFRRRWVASAAVGGLVIGFFVLTGDSGTVATMLGVLAVTGTVGFGTLERHGGRLGHGEFVGALLALMVLGAGTVTAVPGAGSPLAPPGTTSVSGDVVNAGPQVAVGGSISLSPDVFFTVTAPRGAYWRAAAYDRFTGSSWVRTDGAADPVARDGPPAPSDRFTYRVTARRPLDVYPAAATPVAVRGTDAEVTSFGDLQGTGSLATNESYTVVSEQPVLRVDRLQRAGTDYPPVVQNRYLQVPASTTDRVRTLTDRITANATTPYESARAIEHWLQTNKAYSLDVPPPHGQVVDSFLFQMDAGYCTYYATAMTVMLRTQGIPARFVVGYTPGQQVDANTWVVRGLNSHAWVEVYFPDVGWVRFDPTPGGPRRQAEQNRIDAAGASAAVGPVPGDDGQFAPQTTGPAFDRRPNLSKLEPLVTENGTIGESPATTADFLRANETVAGTGPGESGGPRLPPPQTLALWSVLLVGVAVGLRRVGIPGRVYRWAWLRVTPRGDPGEQVAGAFARVEYVLGRQSRPRASTETMREFVARASDDERARQVARLAERTRYGNGVSEAEAERARRLARELVDDLAVGWRFRGGDSV